MVMLNLIQIYYDTEKLYGEVIRDYLYDFKTIEFAVYRPPHSEGKNYHAFRHALTP